MLNIGQQIAQGSDLVKLIQQDNFIGWVYDIGYEAALVMTNDLWKANALGVPHNSFLLATAFNPDAYTEATEEEREVLLLRVIGPARLPKDDEIVRAKIDYFQKQTDVHGSSERDYDDVTRNWMQFHGLECSIRGTFFIRDGELWLGSDIESYASATRLNVYRPRGRALETIVNYVDPIRRKKAAAEAAALGIKGAIKPFRVGTVRYTSTDRQHRRDAGELVPFHISPSDLLARRTGVEGMTRTGKSNMIKHTVSTVKRVADEGGVPIGQLIYDLNGEYANANQQDKGSIADVYPNDTVRYRLVPAAGFEELRTNFYEQLHEGFGIIQRELEESGAAQPNYVRGFLNMSLDEPDPQARSEHHRWERRVAAYRALLHQAGFPAPANYRIEFSANQGVRQAVEGQAGHHFNTVPRGNARYLSLTPAEAVEWFMAARTVNNATPLTGSSGPWVDDTLRTLLDMMAQEQNGTFISGFRLLADARKFHAPARSSNVADEIYQHLVAGKIVILDFSVGDPRIKDRISKDVATKVFYASMNEFIEGRTPPNIMVYVEEAHNLFGKNDDLTETWPRLAKEGAKFGIGLVYATQEVSSIHPNILANTENWFVTHLNNDREVKELARFYDFADFSTSIIRAQDVGFARVKTLSSPFVVPVQIDLFDPEAEKRRLAGQSGGGSAAAADGGSAGRAETAPRGDGASAESDRQPEPPSAGAGDNQNPF